MQDFVFQIPAYNSLQRIFLFHPKSSINAPIIFPIRNIFFLSLHHLICYYYSFIACLPTRTRGTTHASSPFCDIPSLQVTDSQPHFLSRLIRFFLRRCLSASMMWFCRHTQKASKPCPRLRQRTSSFLGLFVVPPLFTLFLLPTFALLLPLHLVYLVLFNFDFSPSFFLPSFLSVFVFIFAPPALIHSHVQIALFIAFVQAFSRDLGILLYSQNTKILDE